MIFQIKVVQELIVSDLADRQQRVEEISLASQDILPDMTGAIAAHTLGSCIKSYR